MWILYMLTSTVASKFTFKITINNFFDAVDELISKTGFPSDV